MAENVKDFLGGQADTIKSEYVVQDNKTKTIFSRKKPGTLEAFF